MAYDFANDPDCVALYRCEAAALTADSVGTNTLTLSVSPPTADGTDYKEGTASAEFVAASSQVMSCADASLSAGFPFKSGGASTTFTVAFWLMAAGDTCGLLGKGPVPGDNFTNCWRLAQFKNVSNRHYIVFAIGDQGGISEDEYTVGSSPIEDDFLAPGNWFHVVAAYNSVTKESFLDVWNPATGEKKVATYTFTNNPRVTATPLVIGAAPSWDSNVVYANGNLDEVAFFKKVLTTKEIDQIRGVALWKGIFTVNVALACQDLNVITLAPWYGRSKFPISERLAWSTDILRSRTKSEQRRCRRTIPLQSYTIPYILETPGEATELNNLLHAWKDRKWPVPIWGEAKSHAANLTASDTTITVDTSYASFRAGGLVMIWQRDKAEWRKIDTVAAGSLTLVQGLLNSYSGDKWIVPVRQGSVEGYVLRERLASGAGVVMMDLTVDDIADVTGHTAAMVYDGLEVWTTPAKLLRSTWSESTDPQGIKLETVSGKVQIVSDADFALSTQDHGWACASLAEVWALRQRLHAIRGRQKSFLVPTFHRDIEPTRPLASNGTTLYVRNRKYATMGVNTLRTYIGFRPSGGSLVVRKITGISTVSATEESFTLNAAPGVAVPVNSLICWVDRCRLAEDQIEITWHKRGVATCETKLARIEQ